MAHEYSKAEYYDSATNHVFRRALIDQLLTPAYVRAYFEEAHADGSDYIVVDEEIQYEGCRIKYALIGSADGQSLTITSCALTHVEDVTNEASRLLYTQMQNSFALDPEFKVSFWGQPEKIQRDAAVETFTKYTFDIHLYEGTVTVGGEVGVTVNGREIISNEEDSLLSTELDQNRTTVFEVDEFVEIIRALLALGLVEPDEVKEFLRSF